MHPRAAPPPLIAHVVAHFGTGGLENGMVNLLDHLPAGAYRHAIVCLDGYTGFRDRFARTDIAFHALGKKPGKDPAVWGRLWRLLRSLRPDIVHTRNLSALEAQFVAAAAGVRARIHGVHGRDVFDLDGSRYRRLRRLARALVHRYVAVSRDLARWLETGVGVPAQRIVQIYNGVDAARFHPRAGARPRIGPEGFAGEDHIVIGSVGRMAEVKDYPSLVRAFVELVSAQPALKERLRLAVIGEGVARERCIALLNETGCAQLAWLPGERDDIPELMRAFDLFVLPSLGEGISNTILEAMASGLAVVATRVGGNPELVEDGVTGTLVPANDPQALARALARYLAEPERLREHGRAARKMAQESFSIEAMAGSYLRTYDDVSRSRGVRALGDARACGEVR
ncbi:MAG: sugar transferase [Betaproteobacteria bacterium CG2_30_68_42]|nr:MAG: sugar transferase [Betaproteobacteria bacterium CG2_30_68_42]PIX75407.1 MAG: sugar transferase [Rhodocyclales bacterium CG_4_10_14_3_um_filter_68_10]PJA57943.1 MAG: sugar transferase [Rhodocyclales bacterium CG_4_9_14_3_um_filter_68_10]